MENTKEIILTSTGYKELEDELQDLKLNKRTEIVEAIKEARSHGDLSENSEYDAARDEQAQLEARIQELEYKLEHATISDGATDKVAVGSTVTVVYEDDEDDDEIEYKIVGGLEANPFENKISNESPIGQAIIGAKVGDIIAVTSPNGSYNVKIVKIA